MEARLKEAIRKYVRERNIQRTLDEMSVTGGVAGYNTPAAFSKGPGQFKKNAKRLAATTGYDVVDEAGNKVCPKCGQVVEMCECGYGMATEGEKDWALGDVPASRKEALPIKPTAVKKKDDGSIADVSGMILAKDDAENTLKENRWLELKREESSPRAKVGRGVSNIHRQLSEIEKFVNWYSKIKTENGLKKEDYWKRTNASLYKIRERLMGITEKLRTL